MKITKDTQTVWKLEDGDMIIGKIDAYYCVKTDDGVFEYSKSDMIEIYGLTEDQFDNIEKSGI